MTEESGLGQYLPVAISFISMIIAAIAALAAWRSAQASKESNEGIEKIHKSEMYRQVSLLANKVVSMTVRVDDLGNDLKLEYQELFIHAEQPGGSRQPMYITAVEEKQQFIRPMQEVARKFLDGLGDPHTFSNTDLVRAVAEFEGLLTQLERVKEKFTFDIENVRHDNRLFRQEVITKGIGQD
jgi:hypothetical protein